LDFLSKEISAGPPQKSNPDAGFGGDEEVACMMLHRSKEQMKGNSAPLLCSVTRRRGHQILHEMASLRIQAYSKLVSCYHKTRAVHDCIMYETLKENNENFLDGFLVRVGNFYFRF
jgi:hypothetical protein